MPRWTASVVLLVAGLAAAVAQRDGGDGFTLMLAGIGPVNQDVSSPDTQWAMTRPWQQYLAVNMLWDAPPEAVRDTLDLGWSVILTAWGSSVWRNNSRDQSGTVANHRNQHRDCVVPEARVAPRCKQLAR